MGSSSSKAARAAGSAARRYPSKPSTSTTTAPRTSNAPSQAPPAGAQTGPTVHPQARVSEARDEAVNLDASDPQYASQLRSLGAVKPQPHFSNSSTSPYDPHPSRPTSTNPSLTTGSSNRQQTVPSTSDLAGPPPTELQHGMTFFPDPKTNPAVKILEARQRLQGEADREFEGLGRKSSGGRRFLDVIIIRQILMMRDERGLAEDDIEKRLGLAPGVVERLGPKGVIGVS